MSGEEDGYEAGQGSRVIALLGLAAGILVIAVSLDLLFHEPHPEDDDDGA